ncbi:MAG: DUF1559 domain-containing protein [Verrucomicrobiae bacterium]|nr:DUF1559 domain-containing protein [Verrucomicrobiae bacterium]
MPAQRRSRPAKWTAAAFTLVELLVVLAIISILASLLMSGVTKARDKAKQISCMNNLKQLSTAILMYAQEHEDRLPPLWGALGDNWWDMTSPYMGKQVTSLDERNQIKIFKCPAELYLTGGSKGPVYAMNNALKDTALSNASHYEGCALSEIKNAASTMLAGDGFYNSTWGNSSSILSSISDGVNTGISYRHMKGANFSFIDGHVSWQEQPAPSSLLTKQ